MADSDGEEPVPVIDRLVDTLARTFADVMGSARTAVLLDVPTHNNSGDSAILCGEIALIASLDLDLERCVPAQSYDRAEVADASPDVVLLHGGGNLGDLWPGHQEFRARVIEDFPTTKVVVLPQSVEFTDDSVAASQLRLWAQHPDLTVLARDAHSEEVLLRHLSQSQVVRCPDAAYAATLRPPAMRSDPLWLQRRDREQIDDGLPDLPAGVTLSDWPLAFRGVGALPLRLRHKISARLDRLVPGRHLMDRYWIALADRRAQLASDLVGGSPFVVTERMHGHILATMHGTEHVVIDNSYGKTSRYTDTWQTLGPTAVLAPNREVAAELLRRRLGA